ncbi:MAG: ComF family protein [Candidatus Kaiserbacteria bacterium]|nr:ComF family protein [Candidatus Kaiserbacteria bacterium]
MNRALAAVQSACLSILDAILPLRERAARTKERRVEDFALASTSHDLLGTKITTLMDYREDAVQDLIRSLKYDRSTYAAHVAATLLAEYLLEEIASHKAFSQKKVLLVPVPLHKARAKERGFNQITLVLDALPSEFKDGTLATLAPGVIERTRETKPQTRLHRSERLSNVAGAFTIADPSLAANAQVFVIDDVTTTGATLANAGNPLRRAGASVSLLALARA